MFGLSPIELAVLIGFVIAIVLVLLNRVTVYPRANLVTCRDCGKRISPNAPQCPKCGRPANIPVAHRIDDPRNPYQSPKI